MRNFFLYCVLSIILLTCNFPSSKLNNSKQEIEATLEHPLPIINEENLTVKWVLNHALSDEFNELEIDNNKWFIQGYNGQYHLWKGVAPSQFISNNVYQTQNVLSINSKWNPEYTFSNETYEGKKYENVTSGGIISKHKIHYGFIEIKAKIADSSVSSSFGIRNEDFELQIFDQVGMPRFKQTTNNNPFQLKLYSLQEGVTIKRQEEFSFPIICKNNLSKDFHIYGFYWNDTILQLFIDGNLIYEMTKQQLNFEWPLTKKPVEIWLNTNASLDYGLPIENDLPTTFKIDYIRTWESHRTNIISSKS